MYRKAGSRHRSQRTASFMPGHLKRWGMAQYNKRRSCLAILLPCAVIFLVVLLFQSSGEKGDGARHPISLSTEHELGTLSGQGSLRYAIVIDAGSTGSRVHVFEFEVRGEDLNLLDSFFEHVEPGLSSYKDNPVQAGASLAPLLDKAKGIVPEKMHSATTVEVRATAGLRLLEEVQVQNILAQVEAILRRYPFRLLDGAVSVLDGSDEGVFMWVSTNYYLGNIGKPYSQTASVIDLGGGSVQRAYAIKGSTGSSAGSSVRPVKAGGVTYQVYVHSYLGFGLKASRLAFLEAYGDNPSDGHPCMLKGFEGEYRYVNANVTTKSMDGGANVGLCMDSIEKEMQIGEGCAVVLECSFSGVWNGGGGEGAEANFISSYIVDIAHDIGIVPQDSTKQVVNMEDFREASEKVCGIDYKDTTLYFRSYLGGLDDRPYMCMDVVFVYVLLNKGFGIPANGEFTVVKQFDYRGKKVEAAWPLGAAIHTVGSLAT